MALSIFESVVLILNALIDDFLGRGLRYFTNGKVNIKLDAVSTAACQFFEFAELWNGFIAAYIMLAFGIDRVLSISLPHKFHRDLLINETLIVYMAIMIVGAALSAPVAANFGIKYDEHDTIKPWHPQARSKR
ncbi:unnamed protein product [Mesocestoides corti]|uniref:G-protein coupled receptors family 1 profile domain-containing protein n=1 Tax=Mesocestoides corti TaxID=53468 RepID=A0A0R3UJE2_MESCO|nr:unnamed protein product [Mesocestoides corti]